MNDTTFDVDKSKRFYELLAIVVGIPVTLCGVLGFITKHSYHESLGVRPLQLPIMEYIKTGALVEVFVIVPLVGLVVVGLLTHSIWQTLKELFPVFFFSLETGVPTHEVPRVLKFAMRGIMLALFFGFLGAGLLTVYGLSRSGIESDWGKVWLSGIITAGGLLFIAYLTTKGGRDSRQQLALAFLALVFTAGCAAGHAALFGRTVYASVPASFAGGSPRRLHLSLKNDHETMQFAISKGLVMGEGDAEVDEVQLVEEVADGYLLSMNELFGERRIVFLERDMVLNDQKN